MELSGGSADLRGNEVSLVEAESIVPASLCFPRLGWAKLGLVSLSGGT